MPKISVDTAIKIAEKTGVKIKLKPQKNYVYERTYHRDARAMGLPKAFCVEKLIHRNNFERLSFYKKSSNPLVNVVRSIFAKRVDVDKVDTSTIVRGVRKFKRGELKTSVHPRYDISYIWTN